MSQIPLRSTTWNEPLLKTRYSPLSAECQGILLISSFCLFLFYPWITGNFPEVCLCWWDEPGRGPSPDQTGPLTCHYTTALSRWKLPLFESLSLAPTLVHCHQPALDQSRGAWQKEAKGAGNFIAKHASPGVPEKAAGVGIKSEWTQ